MPERFVIIDDWFVQEKNIWSMLKDYELDYKSDESQNDSEVRYLVCILNIKLNSTNWVYFVRQSKEEEGTNFIDC